MPKLTKDDLELLVELVQTLFVAGVILGSESAAFLNEDEEECGPEEEEILDHRFLIVYTNGEVVKVFAGDSEDANELAMELNPNWTVASVNLVEVQ